MSVARILARKGMVVYTTTPQQSLQEAAAELARRRIGALVVLDDAERVIGVIAERDIVEAIARGGASALQDQVLLHMQSNWRFATEHDSIDDMSETMTQERCRHMPVLREGRLAGLVSIGDVVKYRIETIDAERVALREYIATA